MQNVSMRIMPLGQPGSPGASTSPSFGVGHALGSHIGPASYGAVQHWISVGPGQWCGVLTPSQSLTSWQVPGMPETLHAMPT